MVAPGETVLGRYVIEDLLGEGGMGKVYRSRQTTLGLPVAVKVMQRQERADLVERFEREAQLMSRVQHPNVVRVLDYGLLDDGAPCLVMELLDGEALETRLARRVTLPWREALVLQKGLLEGLGAIHAAGVVHRDLKPENLFVTRLGGESDFIKVLDFGVAKVLAAETENPDLTSDNALLGTPAFMSPEQVSGDVTDARSDVYALGAVLFYVLTGKKVFSAATISALLVKHMHEQPAAPSALAPAVGPGLDALVLRCLAKNPDERFADGTKLAEALRAVDRSATGVGA